MNCRDFHEIIDSYLSDELLTETNHGILRHLEECAGCRAEIEGRRAVRGRLKSAVLSCADYRIDPAFDTNLGSTLRQAAIGESPNKIAFWRSRNSWIAVAASLLVTFTLGFWLLGQFDAQQELVANGRTPFVEELKPANLVNIALGDHEHCAIRHNLDESPVSLETASANYRDLDKVVVPSLKGVLSEYELVEAHACKFNETRFAHIVLQDREKTLSVLITDSDGSDDVGKDQILRFSSARPNYQIAQFNMKKRAIFVVSDLDREKNSEAIRTLFEPLRRHFDDKDQFQTALLAFY